LVSGRTGIDLTIQIIAIEDGERLCLLLGMGTKSIEDQEKSQNQNDYKKQSPLHDIHLKI
jgi:hypothetical protein